MLNALGWLPQPGLKDPGPKSESDMIPLQTLFEGASGSCFTYWYLFWIKLLSAPWNLLEVQKTGIEDRSEVEKGGFTKKKKEMGNLIGTNSGGPL